MKQILRKATLALSIAATPHLVEAGVVTYDFDDNTLQGWTNVQTSTNGPSSFVTGFAQVNGPTPHGSSNVQVIPNVSAFTQRGDGSYEQDEAHAALILRSPVFRVDGTGDITIHLAGGSEDDGFPSHENDVLGTSSIDDGGFLGVALRDNDTGEYLRWRSRPFGNDSRNYLRLDIRALDLSSSGFTNRDLTLDLIDSSHGAWGWISMDTVTIAGHVSVVPEPSSFALICLGCCTLGIRRWKHLRRVRD